jgi:hypothetical protein
MNEKIEKMPSMEEVFSTTTCFKIKLSWINKGPQIPFAYKMNVILKEKDFWNLLLIRLC